MNKIKYSNLNQTIIYHNKDKGLYFKSSYDKNSIKSLNNEYEGFNWYFSKKPELDKSFTNNLKKSINNNFGKIQIPELPGYSVKASNPIHINERYILRGINEYFSISNKNDFRFHGDFSVGNLIFNKNECYIIDWEHSLIEKSFWGVDVLNIFFESIFFSFNKEVMSKKNIQSAKNVYRNILRIFKEKNIKLFTIHELIELYRSNSLIWGNSISKLPLLKFNSEQLKVIDSFQKSN